MRIQIDPSGGVDFEAPVFMNVIQKKNFVQFMKALFPDMELIENVPEKEKYMNIGEKTIKKWTAEDYYYLITISDIHLLMTKLNRSEMSILMKYGSFVPHFLSWAHKNGFNKPFTHEMIKNFIMEYEK